jgi:hypothetical protein
MLGLNVDPTNDRLAELAIDACLGLGDDASATRIRDRCDLEVRDLDDEQSPRSRVSHWTSA